MANTPLALGSNCTALVRYTGPRIRPSLPMDIGATFYHRTIAALYADDPLSVFVAALGIRFCYAA